MPTDIINLDPENIEDLLLAEPTESDSHELLVQKIHIIWQYLYSVLKEKYPRDENNVPPPQP